MIGQEHRLFSFVDNRGLETLLEALSARLGASLTLLDGGTGTIIVTTSDNSEWFASHWLTIKDQLNTLPAGVTEQIGLQDCSLIGSRFSVAGMELALLTGIGSERHPGTSTKRDFESIQRLLWQYLQGQVSAYYEPDFVAMIERARLPDGQLTSADCYRHIGELVDAIPGVTMAVLRIKTPAGTGRLVARIGNCPEDVPEELPLAGIWGKCLLDGQERILDNLAEDPGVPSHILPQLAGYSAIYLPLGWGNNMIAVLKIAFAQRDYLHSPHTRELLTLVKRHSSVWAALAQSNESLLRAKCQLRGQAQLVDRLAEFDLETLADIEALISVLWGLSWVRIGFTDCYEEEDIPDLVRIPLEHGGLVVAYVYAKGSEVEGLVPELLDLGIDFLSHFVHLWGKLADMPQPQENKVENPLTPREMEVAQLIAAGESNKTAAAQLNLSEKTIKTHVSNILRKLNLPNRTAIAVWYTKKEAQ